MRGGCGKDWWGEGVRKDDGLVVVGIVVRCGVEGKWWDFDLVKYDWKGD